MWSVEHDVGLPGSVRAGAMAPTIARRSDSGQKARIDPLADQHYELVWRSARRLGVRSADLDDVVRAPPILTWADIGHGSNTECCDGSSLERF